MAEELDLLPRYQEPKKPRSQSLKNRPGESWTIGDALHFLDPTPPRRTLSRWLTKIESDGDRKIKHGGPPAKTYPARAIMEQHARWARRGHFS